MFGQLAEGILDDLAVKGKNLIEGADPADSLAQKNAERIETALNISRIGNDIFTRAFAGDVLAKKERERQGLRRNCCLKEYLQELRAGRL